MKIVLLLFFLVGVVGCSHQNTTTENSTAINRDVAAGKFDAKSFPTFLDQTKAIFPKLGNPRYYIFEHFTARAKTILKGTSDLDLLKLSAAYKVMAEAGIYLNYSKIVDTDKPEVGAKLDALETAMAQLYDQVVPKFFPEDMANALTTERLLMVKSLSQRISRNYKTFVKSAADRAAVKSAIKQILAFKPEGVETEYKVLKANKNFVRATKILSNLNLPEVGDIDGSDDAFESVMSVQISIELVNVLVDRELRN